jgi:ribosome-binding factor A
MRHRKRSYSPTFDRGRWHPRRAAGPWDPLRERQPRQDTGRKARQLCRQVADTLGLVLAGECQDEVLQNLLVLAVDPAPDASRLLVTLGLDLADGTVTPADVLSRLDRAAGWLRSEIATAIHRKRTPQLAYRVVASGVETGW